jgi:ABC-type spermidine/putrescine transport system permease subunit II
MAISAQAEPIVQPYYISNPRQVAGIVAGLMGGASYEKLVPRTGLASQYWNSFSFATFTAVVLVILGSIASVFMLWMSLRNHGKLEAE